MTSRQCVSCLLTLCLLVSLLGGCGGAPQRPRGPVDSTAAYRFQYELIGNAQRVRVDTQPQWQNGRYAWRDGAEELLVISRITSWADNVSDDQRRTGSYKRTDRIIERLWLSLPPDMEVGKWLDLYELNGQLRVGYDEKPSNSEEFFIRPFGVQGKMMLWQQNGQEKTFRLSLRVSPKERMDWNLNETITLTGATTGVLAHKAADDAPFTSPRVVSLAERDLQKKLLEEGQPAEATTPGEEAVPTAVAVADAPVVDAAANPASPEAELRTKMLGQWIGDTGVYEMRMQFDDNNTFVYSSSRSGFSPGMKYGKWEIRGDYLVMQVQRFEFDGTDHMRFLKRNPFIILRVRWLNDQLSLFGDYRDREGAAGNMRVDFTKNQFEDMNVIIPPARK